MLQRAASSAYSWWWASHIRTKQSKWLEQNLQDMDDKVGSMLSIIDEDGDSFAKRAEMYYRKRPELVHLVEESFRAYRALAERYDHISRDLQSANRTIATVYPEKVHFTALDDDDDEERQDSSKKLVNQENATMPKSNIPKVPTKNFKPLPTLRTKRAQLQQQLKRTSSSAKAVPCSGLSKGEALEEIDKLQKGILALQTEKEFVKSTYENAITKYLEIENRISEMQVKVCGLQDEFGIGTVIEDNEARKLMATTALKSCRETLNRLQEKQENLAREASMEQGKIKEAHQRLQAFKDEFYVDELSDKPVLNEINKLPSEYETGTNFDHVAVKTALQSLDEKMKKLGDADGNESLTVANLVDRIDDMVDAVVNLETAVASSSAMVQRLKSEADEVQDNVQALEKDKDKISVGSNIIRQKAVELEVEMVRFQNLNQALENQNTGLVSHFIQASDSLEQLAEKVEKFKFDEMVEIAPWNVAGKDGDVHMLSAKNNLKISEKPKKGDKFLDVVSQFLSSSSGKHQAINSLDAGKEVVNSESVGQDHETMASLEDELEIITEDSVQFEVSQREFPAENEEQSITPETANEGSRRDEAPFHDHDINESFTEHQSGSLEEENIEIVDSTCRLYEDEDPKQDEKKKTCSNSSQEEGKEEKLGPESDAAFVENRGSRWRRLVENSEGELDWRRLFVSGLEDREKFLVDEYTSVIKTLKEARRKLSEVEKKSREGLNEQASKMKEIMHANSLKDREIESLRRTLSMLKMSSGEKECITLQDTSSQPALREGAVPKETELLSSELAQKTANDAIENTVDETQPAIMEIILNEEPHFVSSIEEKFRSDLDEMLGENLEFWLRFCTSVHQIQKFQSSIEDLQMEAAELMESKKQGTNSRNIESLKADAKPIYMHLKEIQAELHLWLQHNSLLKEELENRHSSLSDIQEDITRLSNATEDSELSEYQAAKFQGEVANMKQENDKVADELQSCIRRVKNLHADTDRTLRTLNEEFGLIELERKHSRSRIPLRTFLFGVRLKKPKHSFFRCISPALQKQYSDLASQFPPPR